MITRKIVLLLFTYLLITTNVFSAGSSGSDGAKKLSSYDSAVNKIKNINEKVIARLIETTQQRS